MKSLYPESPFKTTFDSRIILQQHHIMTHEIQNDYLEAILKWICTTPTVTSYRVNTLTHSVDDILSLLTEKLRELCRKLNCTIPCVKRHELLPEVILIDHCDIKELDLDFKANEVVVDVHCGAAVLRGSHIFAPGVLAMLSGSDLGDQVSVFVDVEAKCKKGLQKRFECPHKVFIGNGIIKMTRNQLFGENLNPEGVAIEVFSTLSGCPPLGEGFLPEGSALLQNIPSIICAKVLNPQPGEAILDMCAAPGNKTTHIAALIQNEGTLVAIDKTPKKVEKLTKNCKKHKARVYSFLADSTAIFDNNLSQSKVFEGPPFSGRSFDRILLDAPCSALGKRPQFYNNISEKVLKSYVPLQRKLFHNAVNLLKSGGVLVYSTCTITLAENEGIVSWALKTFEDLELVKPDLVLGGIGLEGSDLSEEQRGKLQRFGPGQVVDSVGFFIACFQKRF